MKDERDIQEENLMEDLEDPMQARDVRRSLEQLRTIPGVDPRLQEMARELLSGRTGLKDIIENPRYLAALGDNMRELQERDDRMTPEERERSKEQAAEFFRQQEEDTAREDAEREQAAREARENGPKPRHRGGQ
ncbi:hypothetical protein JGS22_000075 [Streptomyces sp. P38-E01]|uniref:Uncharacterized protein n=1 Tax=Streptomyces tardus TaxID=2780544 RepID=A0A949JBN5_9ACTN|nr:hypothetical protein [Streptomyces tardus]MBU7596068.1 hypothetical protein [Streptomyces tardus]